MTPKRSTARLVPGLAILLLAGCGDPGSSASPLAEGEADAISSRGETLSLACQACHSLVRNGPQLVGPNLWGVFGRRAGSLTEYDAYSAALRAADFSWTPELLDGWLTDPAGFLPGTSMAFTGYRSADDRAALIAYLVAATGG